jgi:hypothetical protein
MTMRHAALLLVLMISACQCAPPAPVSHDAELKASFEDFISAFNELDWDRFSRHIAADASLFNPDIPDAPSVIRIDGGEAVKASFEQVFAAARKSGSGPGIHPQHILIQSYGTTGIVSFEFKRQGNSIGRRSIVFEWRDGDWKIVHIHASNVTSR